MHHLASIVRNANVFHDRWGWFPMEGWLAEFEARHERKYTSLPYYGIHGTPEPAQIGKTESHGCIRLTNWDAAELAQMVHPGLPAILQE